MTELDLPDKAIRAFKLHAPQGVVEIGAGNGRWGKAIQSLDIPWIGYDIKPGENVQLGDHNNAASHPTYTFLAVWPPDGDCIQHWINAYDGDTIMLCAHHERLYYGNVLSDWQQVLSAFVGPKTHMKVYIRGIDV